MQKKPSNQQQPQPHDAEEAITPANNNGFSPSDAFTAFRSSRTHEAFKQLFCGGIAGSVAKTVTAPFSRLTILFQVHSLVTTKEHRPKFAMSLSGGVEKIVERGGILSLWKGNMTSVLHRFPYSAINFYVYENMLDVLSGMKARQEERNETPTQLVRRMTKIVMDRKSENDNDDEDDNHNNDDYWRRKRNGSGSNSSSSSSSSSSDDSPALHKFLAGATAGTVACCACYPLDLVRTRLTTQFEGYENYRGIADAFQKIYKAEGFLGFYSGIGATVFVAVPNFAISYTIYGTLKEYTLDDELFYNLRRIDSDSGEEKMGFLLTVLCGAISGTLATLTTFPMDTIRRRMQIQNLHVAADQRLTSAQQLRNLVMKEGLGSLYRGLTPELLKVVPMVGTMFLVYDWTRDMLNVGR